MLPVVHLKVDLLLTSVRFLCPGVFLSLFPWDEMNPCFQRSTEITMSGSGEKCVAMVTSQCPVDHAVYSWESDSIF